VSQQTTNRYFDELARAMAEGSLSRRRALKLFAGTAIAALIPSRALADDDCVRVCHVPFDRVTGECDFANARTRCVSRRERRRHLENHPCDCRGSCRNCLTPDEICTVGPDLCESACGPEGAPCACAPTTEGQTACIDAFCGTPCNSSDDCPAGAVCGLVAECCGESVCLFPCGTLDSSSSAVQESSAWGAPQA
jgi:hypothetical protein